MTYISHFPCFCKKKINGTDHLDGMFHKVIPKCWALMLFNGCNVVRIIECLIHCTFILKGNNSCVLHLYTANNKNFYIIFQNEQTIYQNRMKALCFVSYKFNHRETKWNLYIFFCSIFGYITNIIWMMSIHHVCMVFFLINCPGIYFLPRVHADYQNIIYSTPVPKFIYLM